MRKIFAIILILVLVLGLSACGTTEADGVTPPREMDGDFRYANWGATRNEVKAGETAKLLISGEDTLEYETEIAGHENVRVVYFFDDNILYSTMYVFTDTYPRIASYVTTYYDLKDLLIQKYGAPIDEELFWLDSTYKDVVETVDNLATAVGLGHLVYSTKWEEVSAKIELYMYGESDSPIYTAIIYDSKEFAKDDDDVDIDGL